MARPGRADQGFRQSGGTTDRTVENPPFQSLDGDQRREAVNTRQRFDLFRDAEARADGHRGFMVFATVNGGDCLLRSFPRDVVEAAAPLFAGERAPDARFDG